MSHRILFLHAHPDDAEIFAGGTLALLAAKGHSVTIATMTAGDCGTTEYSAEEISRIRREEARRGAAQLGAGYECLEFRDLAIFADDPSRRRVTAALRRHRPTIVITASPADYHCDHETTSRLVLDACFAVSAPNYDTSAYTPEPALDAIPHLYFADPAEGTDREGRAILPQFLVDVTSTFDAKREALAAHDSQRAWLMRQHGMDDYLVTMEEWCRARGGLAGVPLGEGFRQYTGHPWPRTPLLQQLLGDPYVHLLDP
jgi:LmbE family N-acetylglucosaminyl deacetylase